MSYLMDGWMSSALPVSNLFKYMMSNRSTCNEIKGVIYVIIAISARIYYKVINEQVDLINEMRRRNSS